MPNKTDPPDEEVTEQPNEPEPEREVEERDPEPDLVELAEAMDEDEAVEQANRILGNQVDKVG
jgi:hypothetical protein